MIRLKTLSMVLFVSALLSSCTNDKLEIPDPVPSSPCDSINVKYTADIKPLLTTKCIITNCHSTGDPQGDFNSYTVLKIKADNGRLNQRVVQLKDMPEIGSGITMTADERKKFDCWIKAGAPNN